MAQITVNNLTDDRIVTASTDDLSSAIADWFHAGDTEVLATVDSMSSAYADHLDPSVPSFRRTEAARVADHLASALGISIQW